MRNLEDYVNNSKSNKTFEFIKAVKLKNILYLFSAYIFYIYIEEIKNNNCGEELMEIKAHTIFIYLGAIIEAIIFDFVNSKLNDEKSKRKYLKLKEYKQIQKIKETKDLHICKLIEKEINLNDSINFAGLINGLKDKKLIDNNIIEKINSFRKMRNLVHINVLINSNELNLIEKLEKAFLDTKEILDYIKNNLEGKI